MKWKRTDQTKPDTFEGWGWVEGLDAQWGGDQSDGRESTTITYKLGPTLFYNHIYLILVTQNKFAFLKNFVYLCCMTDLTKIYTKEALEGISSDDFYYDLTSGGYIDPNNILLDKDRAKKLQEAINLIWEWEIQLQEDGVLEVL